MSLVTDEHLSHSAYLARSLQPHLTPLGDYSRPEATTSPPLKQAGAQKTTTVTGAVCVVCSEVSAKDSAFRKHYGVVCCEACKCFFRRTVQMSRDYKCRYDGQCVIGRFPENIKQVCQACRFTQCIRAGMKMESVKKFPRKGGVRSGDGENGEASGDQAKFQKVLKNFSKGKRKSKTMAGDVGGGGEGVGGEGMVGNGAPVTCHVKQERAECELEPDPELDPFKYSTEFHSVLSSAVPQLISYDSTTGDALSALATTGGSNGLRECVSVSRPHLQLQETTSGKRSGADLQTVHAKKMRLEAALSHIHPPSPNTPIALTSPFSPPPLPQSAPYTPPSFHHHSSHYSTHQYGHCGSLVNSPESHPPSVYNSHANTPYATPHVTPHATPHGTPVHSPLPSPTAGVPSLLPTPPPLHPYPTSSSLLTPLSLSTFTPRNNLLLSQNSGAVFLNSTSQMPFRVVPVAQPILPFMASFPSFTPTVHSCSSNITAAGPSPFSVVPIPSSTTRTCRTVTQPEEEVPQPFLPQPSLPPKDTGEVEESLASAPPSARASPEPSFNPRSITGDTFPEAELDEVLDSLKQRIRTMFSWAKYDVAGFEDLSPLDQKALLRRTVAELVMLGFARASIAYSGVLLLGKTGKAIRPTNSNSGVSAVASVTLKKLVEPLKVVNMDDTEYNLMMEIVLFNPESSCLRNREVVRAHRKRSHISLKEYTDKQSTGDLGRFGELMCLLTPLFEVSTEVTEQLRLEHFVHEGEARIDALLLMSMINGAEEVGAA